MARSLSLRGDGVPEFWRARRGSALLLVILVLAVLLSMAGALMSLAGTESVTGIQQINQIQAHYIAEAGVEKALASLKLDTQWRQGYTNINYAGGSIDKVTILNEGKSAGDVSVLTITSTGSYRGARRTVEVKAMVSPGGYTLLGRGDPPGTAPLSELRVTGPLVIEADVFLASSCYLQWEAALIGTLRSGGDVVIQSPATVSGDVWARGSIAAGEDTVAGQLYPGAGLDIPLFHHLTDQDLDFMRDAARSCGEGHYFAGAHTFTAGELQNMSGVYFVEGRATVSGQYSGRASIVSPVDIYLPGPLTAAAGANILGLMARGNICAGEGADLVEAVAYASSYTARGSFTEHRGGVIVPVMELNGSLKLGHPLATILPPAIPVEITIIHWKELYPMF